MIKQSRSAIRKVFTPSLFNLEDLKEKFENHAKVAKQEIHEIERLTHLLCEQDSLDDSTIFMAYNGNFDIEHVSRQVGEALGYQSQELLGTSIFDHVACRNNMQCVSCPEKKRCSIAQLMHEGKSFKDNKIQLAAKDGTSIWTKLSGYLLHDAQQQLRKGIVVGILL
ncbi:MAG: hypothetical protein CMB80_08155 [Flammeovirgaceae bacterium]|nr:hypothetical protein [Flammeovirgaceae bacterium]|tara:strand:+ start:372 stop:872 length:501 start_codon:yes stop_codon:yes gene_type:complete